MLASSTEFLKELAETLEEKDVPSVPKEAKELIEEADDIIKETVDKIDKAVEEAEAEKEATKEAVDPESEEEIAEEAEEEEAAAEDDEQEVAEEAADDCCRSNDKSDDAEVQVGDVINEGHKVQTKKRFYESSSWTNDGEDDGFEIVGGYEFETPDDSVGDFFDISSWDIANDNDDDDFATADIEEIDDTNGWAAWGGDDNWDTNWGGNDGWGLDGFGNEKDDDAGNGVWDTTSFFDDNGFWDNFDFGSFSPLLW